MNNHWTDKYIGLPYSNDYNCFDHFVHVQKEKFKLNVLNGILNLPRFEEKEKALEYIKTEKTLSGWREVDDIKEGDAVLFGAKGISFHIGTYIESNKVKGILHNKTKHGVVLTTLQALRNNVQVPIFMRFYDS